MKQNKIFGSVALALVLILASCGENLDNPANLAVAASAVSGGQTNNPSTALLSNFKYAVGSDSDAITETNSSNWNPKTVEFLEKVVIAFDVNTSKQIKSLKYIEILNNKIVLESQITANLNASYTGGVGRVGKSLCLATVINAGVGEFEYKIEVAFEDGSVSAITSNPIQVGKLSTANRTSNLRVAPMIDTSDAWNVLNTTGADAVEGEHGRIAFTVPNWSETDNIKNIYHVIWLKDDSGVYRQWWWTTTGIGNFGEKAWSKAANNSLYTPVLKPEGEVRYEVFVNFKDGTTERLSKEITSARTLPLSNIRWAKGDNGNLIADGNKKNWNPAPLNLGDRMVVGFDVNTDLKIAKVKYIEYMNNEVVYDQYLNGDGNIPYQTQWPSLAGYGRVGKALALDISINHYPGDFKFAFEVTYENGSTQTITSDVIKVL